MGMFSVKLRVCNPVCPSLVDDFEIMVSTASAYSWLKRERIEGLDAQPVWRMQFRTKHGQEVERELAPLFVSTENRTAADNFVLAERDELEVLGWHTLNGLGLAVDEVNEKLVPITEGLALSAA